MAVPDPPTAPEGGTPVPLTDLGRAAGSVVESRRGDRYTTDLGTHGLGGFPPADRRSLGNAVQPREASLSEVWLLGIDTNWAYYPDHKFEWAGGTAQRGICSSLRVTE